MAHAPIRVTYLPQFSVPNAFCQSFWTVISAPLLKKDYSFIKKPVKKESPLSGCLEYSCLLTKLLVVPIDPDSSAGRIRSGSVRL